MSKSSAAKCGVCARVCLLRVKGSFNNKITRKLEIKIIIENFCLSISFRSFSMTFHSLRMLPERGQIFIWKNFPTIKELFVTVISSRFKSSGPQKKSSSSSHSLYSSVWKCIFGVLVSSVMMLKGIRHKRELVIISIGSKVITIPSRQK